MTPQVGHTFSGIPLFLFTFLSVMYYFKTRFKLYCQCSFQKVPSSTQRWLYLLWQAVATASFLLAIKNFSLSLPRFFTGIIAALTVVSLLWTDQVQAQTATPAADIAFLQEHIIPTEIMACPESAQSEWIEIYNHSDQPVSATNWYVEDLAGTRKPATITLDAKSYQLITWSSSMLNNSGDTLSLFTQENEPLFTLSYDACQQGQSWSWILDEWQLTDTPTPATVNISTQASPSPTPASSSVPSPQRYEAQTSPGTKITLTEILPDESSESLPLLGIKKTNLEPENKALKTYIQKLNTSLAQRVQSDVTASSSTLLVATESDQVATTGPTLIEDPYHQPLLPQLRNGLLSAILSGSLVISAGLYIWNEEIKKIKHHQELLTTLNQVSSNTPHTMVELD